MTSCDVKTFFLRLFRKIMLQYDKWLTPHFIIPTKTTQMQRRPQSFLIAPLLLVCYVCGDAYPTKEEHGESHALQSEYCNHWWRAWRGYQDSLVKIEPLCFFQASIAQCHCAAVMCAIVLFGLYLFKSIIQFYNSSELHTMKCYIGFCQCTPRGTCSTKERPRTLSSLRRQGGHVLVLFPVLWQ